jgi:hypothetical protein
MAGWQRLHSKIGFIKIPVFNIGWFHIHVLIEQTGIRWLRRALW